MPKAYVLIEITINEPAPSARGWGWESIARDLGHKWAIDTTLQLVVAYDEDMRIVANDLVIKSAGEST
jgi:hypothetical protein